VIAFLDNEEVLHRTEQEMRHVALLVSTIRTDPRMTRAHRVRERGRRDGGQDHETKRKRVAGRKRCASEREADEAAKQMSDEEGVDGRPSPCKRAKTTTKKVSTDGGGGKYVSMKRVLAAIQSIAHEHKECSNLERWVVARWKIGRAHV
jgi:hypothetical protein